MQDGWRGLRGYCSQVGGHISYTAASARTDGRGRCVYAFLGGGTAGCSACRTVRRSTRLLSASSRIDDRPGGPS